MFGLSHFNKNKCMILLNCYVLVKWHCMYDALLKICIFYFTKNYFTKKILSTLFEIISLHIFTVIFKIRSYYTSCLWYKNLQKRKTFNIPNQFTIELQSWKCKYNCSFSKSSALYSTSHLLTEIKGKIFLILSWHF